MRTLSTVSLLALFCLATTSLAQEFDANLKWRARVDVGGSIPEAAELNKFMRPVDTGEMKLSPGFLFDLSVGYRIKPWLEVGPELGFLFNGVESFGPLYYRGDTFLFQIPMMANVQLEYPYWGRLAPYVGAGVGGVGSFLSFFSDLGPDRDGSGSTFALGFQAFAGVRYRFTPTASLGLTYRFLATDEQTWDVDWETGSHWGIGVESVRIHTFCLVLGMSF